MNRSHDNPVVHRMAVATAVVALLPIAVGALVTTMKWGMAFLDWPSSDGHNMLLYPWFRDIAQGRTDKAAEHGHRLAGILIGLSSIALAAVTWRKERRLWVRLLAAGVLLAVIGQGILGGQRVLQNQQMLAMVHGGFAAVVFTMIAALALVTGRSWREVDPRYAGAQVQRLKPVAVATVLVLAVQYVLGGLLRHRGTALHEHIGFAVIALVFVAANTAVAHGSRIGWLRRPAWTLCGLVLLQVLLGAGAFVTRFGFAPSGYVAVQHSTAQVVISTSHTVLAMLVVMASVIYTMRVFRVDGLPEPGGSLSAEKTGLAGPATAEGGL